MGKERTCNRAQKEIENWYVNQFISNIVEGLSKRYQNMGKNVIF